MTDKLYYVDQYINKFDAEILSVSAVDDKFEVILNRSAFFPEEGGQSSDKGFIGDARVIHVYEKEGVLYHVTDSAPVGTHAKCLIDFSDRFEKMQCHSAEHILCGIIHRLYGFENVGFHLGEDVVTFDVSGVLTADQIQEVEALANEVVFSNVKIEAFFPDSEALCNTEYRSKLDITDGVRLVKIGDTDICACCAPHVANTGEIGIIKILDFMKHRGGTRIFMVAGRRALIDYNEKQGNLKRISFMLSAPQNQTADILSLYMKESENNKSSLKQARLKISELYANEVKEIKGSEVFVFPDFSIPELIAFCNIACKRVSNITVALSGTEGDYKYVIASLSADLSSCVKQINSALSGRGGGKGNMIQGSFSASLEQIKSYFIG